MDITENSPQAVAGPQTRSGRRRKRAGRPSTFWRIRGSIPRWLTYSLGVISVLTPFALWFLLRATNQVSELFLPTPADVANAANDMISSGELLKDTRASLQRVVIGFGIAVLISVPLGLAMGCGVPKLHPARSPSCGQPFVFMV